MLLSEVATIHSCKHMENKKSEPIGHYVCFLWKMLRRAVEPLLV